MRRTARSTFKQVYPYANLIWELYLLGHDIGYMFDRTPRWRPWFTLLGVKLERAQPPRPVCNPAPCCIELINAAPAKCEAFAHLIPPTIITTFTLTSQVLTVVLLANVTVQYLGGIEETRCFIDAFPHRSTSSPPNHQGRWGEGLDVRHLSCVRESLAKPDRPPYWLGNVLAMRLGGNRREWGVSDDRRRGSQG